MSSWFNNMKIRNKLLLPYGVVVLIGAVALVMNIRGTSELGVVARALADDVAAESGLVQELREFQQTMSVAELAGKDYLLTGDEAFLDIRRDAKQEAAGHLGRAFALADGGRRPKIEALMGEIELEDAEEEAYGEILALYQSGNREEAVALQRGQSASLGGEIESLIRRSEEALDEASHRAQDEANSQTLSVLLASIVSMAASVAVAGVVAFFLADNITSPISKLRDLADKVSMGDLSAVDNGAKMDAQDEIGDLAKAFDRMVVTVKYLGLEKQETMEA